MEHSSFRDLEDLLDDTSLARILDALANICHHKAAHIRAIRNDFSQATKWEQDAVMLDELRPNN